MSNWSLLTVRVAGSDVAAVQLADGTLVVPDELRPYAGLKAALEDWAALEPLLRALDPTGLTPLTRFEPTATVRYPNKMLGVGANYYDHVKEMGAPRPPDGAPPYMWSVPTTTTFIGSGEEILIPGDPAAKSDWEAEVAVVIGVGGKDLDEAVALDAVAGYACINDITARGYMKRDKPLAPAFTFDWVASKGLDTFKPMGSMTPSWMVGDPTVLSVRCTVNGVLKQNGNTAEMITKIPALVAAASRLWTLQPGDVIATGTPIGVGHPRGEYLSDGDEVRVEVTGLAPLVNPIRMLATTHALVG